MASSQLAQIAPPKPLTQLSYADRAKKAQNLKTPKAQAQAQPLATSSNLISSQANQPVTKASPGTSLVEGDPSSSSVTALPRTGSVAQSPTSAFHTAEEASKDSDTAPVISEIPQPASKSVTNVWSLRREQMAQAQTQSHPPHPPPTFTTQSSRKQNASNDPTPADAASSRPPARANPSNQPKSNTSGGVIPSLNGTAPTVLIPVTPSSSEDPFVVRPPPLHDRRPLIAATVPQVGQSLPPIASTPPQLPSVDDKDSWPEVGKSETVNGVGSVNGSVGDRDSEGKETSGTGRKGTRHISSSDLPFCSSTCGSVLIVLLLSCNRENQMGCHSALRAPSRCRCTCSTLREDLSQWEPAQFSKPGLRLACAVGTEFKIAFRNAICCSSAICCT